MGVSAKRASTVFDFLSTAFPQPDVDMLGRANFYDNTAQAMTRNQLHTHYGRVSSDCADLALDPKLNFATVEDDIYSST